MTKEDVVNLLEKFFKKYGLKFEPLNNVDCGYVVEIKTANIFKNIDSVSFLYFWEEKDNCLILFINNIFKFFKDEELLKVYEIINALNAIIDNGSFLIFNKTDVNKRQVVYKNCFYTNADMYKLNENIIKKQVNTSLNDLEFGLHYMYEKGLIPNEK